MPKKQPVPATRRLAAILFADIAGYTALMQRDEQTALQVLNRFKAVLEDRSVEFQGNIIQYYGDGCLIIFNSSVEAAGFAKAVQEDFRKAPHVPARIGIHLGDIIIEKGNAFGDSVNIASRLESIGVPGAIMLSAAVQDQIRNHPELNVASLGKFHFKNVEAPMEVFALANDGLVVPERKTLKNLGKQTHPVKKWRMPVLLGILAMLTLALLLLFIKPFKQAPPTEIPEKSIAVLPFKNLSAKQENQFFCDGVMEAVLDKISKIKGLTVIARASVEQYHQQNKPLETIANELNVATILQGSVQRDGDRVRISAQLILPESNQQIWSNIYDRQLSDIFAIQTEIAESIADELAIELTPETRATLVRPPTTNLTAYDYYLRGKDNLEKLFFDRQERYYKNAHFNFNQALELDPRLARAYSGLAVAYWLNTMYSFQLGAPKLDSVRIWCEKALAIDPNLPEAHSFLGNYYFVVQNDAARFVEEQLRAIEIDENYAGAYSALGTYYTLPMTGEYEKGIDLIKHALRLNPSSPWTSRYYLDLISAYLNINAFEEAEYYGEKVRESGNISSWDPLVHLYIIQGRYEEAEKLAKEWLPRSPIALRYLTEIEINYHHNYRKAIDMYQEYEKSFPEAIDYRHRIGLAYWLDGQKEKGRRLLKEALDEFDKLTELNGTEYCYDKAGIYATLGDTEKALAQLRDQHCILDGGLESYFLIDPLFQNLWNNTEFQEIVRKRQAEKTAIREKIRQATIKG